MPRNAIAAVASSLLLVGCAPERGAEAEHASSAGPSSTEPVVVAAATLPPYDPATEIEVEGAVTRVREVQSRRGSSGVHLDLAVGDVEYDVHVGPKFYLAEIGFAPSVGDQLRVLGWSGSGNSAALVARRITRGDQTWTFRDPQGRPLWRRRR